MTFQRLMDILLRPCYAYVVTYLDDVVIHSEMGGPSRAAPEGAVGATAGWHMGLAEAKYLGYQIGQGFIKPQEKKVEAIRKAITETLVQAFLGLADYYRCFIPNFSSIASPLTDLTKKRQPEKLT